MGANSCHHCANRHSALSAMADETSAPAFEPESWRGFAAGGCGGPAWSQQRSPISNWPTDTFVCVQSAMRMVPAQYELVQSTRTANESVASYCSVIELQWMGGVCKQE